MKVSQIKSAPQFNSYKWRHFGILTYGETNEFPQTVDEIVKTSKTANACLDIYNDFVCGMGFSDPGIGEIVVNRKIGMKLKKFRRILTRDFTKYYGCAIHVNYNMNYRISSVSLIPFENCRLGIPGDDGVIRKIAIHEDWGQRDRTRSRWTPSDIEWFHVFNPNPDVIERQVAEAGSWEDFKGQILYYSGESEGELSYPVPKYIAEMTDMRTEEGLANVTGRNVCSNFMLAGILVDIMEAEQNESQIQDKQRELMKFQGDENALQLWYTQAKNKDEVPVFVPFSGQNYDKAFTATQSQIPDNIGQAFKQPPILRAKDVGANFGADLMTNAYKFYNSVTVRERTQIEEVLEMVFEYWWTPIENPDFTIEVLVYNAGASIAERIGKDLMTQVLEVVRDSDLILAQKRNILKFGYGLYDEEIQKILPNDDDNDTEPSGREKSPSDRGESKRSGSFANIFKRSRKSTID